MKWNQLDSESLSSRIFHHNAFRLKNKGNQDVINLLNHKKNDQTARNEMNSSVDFSSDQLSLRNRKKNIIDSETKIK